MKLTFLYTLSDPETGKVRYLGKSDEPFKRYKEHLCDKKTTHKARWIQGLKKLGLKPTMEILDEIPETQWQFWEREYIRVFRAIGIPLTNISDGGEGIQMPRTAEHNIKIGLAHLGQKVSGEERKRLLSFVVGRIPSEKQRRAVGDANRHPKSEQTKQNMRAGWVLRKAKKRGIS